jgi:hypothetical protein
MTTIFLIYCKVDRYITVCAARKQSAQLNTNKVILHIIICQTFMSSILYVISIKLANTTKHNWTRTFKYYDTLREWESCRNERPIYIVFSLVIDCFYGCRTSPYITKPLILHNIHLSTSGTHATRYIYL